MRRIRNQPSRVLILVLLLGFTAMTLHTSMHAQPDPQACKVCGGHFDPSHAVALALPPVMPETLTGFVVRPLARSRQREHVVSYRQRAPPILS